MIMRLLECCGCSCGCWVDCIEWVDDCRCTSPIEDAADPCCDRDMARKEVGLGEKKERERDSNRGGEKGRMEGVTLRESVMLGWLLSWRL